MWIPSFLLPHSPGCSLCWLCSHLWEPVWTMVVNNKHPGVPISLPLGILVSSPVKKGRGKCRFLQYHHVAMQRAVWGFPHKAYFLRWWELFLVWQMFSLTSFHPSFCLGPVSAWGRGFWPHPLSFPTEHTLLSLLPWNSVIIRMLGPWFSANGRLSEGQQTVCSLHSAFSRTLNLRGGSAQDERELAGHME